MGIFHKTNGYVGQLAFSGPSLKGHMRKMQEI